jgi:hypothetical protein
MRKLLLILLLPEQIEETLKQKNGRGSRINKKKIIEITDAGDYYVIK